VLRAAERDHRVDAAVAVDPDRAGLEAFGDRLRLVPVGRPDRGAQADLNAVRPLDRLLYVGVADDRQRGAELLLLD